MNTMQKFWSSCRGVLQRAFTAGPQGPLRIETLEILLNYSVMSKSTERLGA
jgi:hypothetical protein